MRGQLCDEEGRGLIEVATRVSSMITLDLNAEIRIIDRDTDGDGKLQTPPISYI